MSVDVFTAATRRPRVVIVGGGFAGLRVASGMRHADAEVVPVDRADHHLFQPLLYQVVTALLPPAATASSNSSSPRSHPAARPPAPGDTETPPPEGG